MEQATAQACESRTWSVTTGEAVYSTGKRIFLFLTHTKFGFYALFLLLEHVEYEKTHIRAICTFGCG
jgi:hypothetical protein